MDHLYVQSVLHQGTGGRHSGEGVKEGSVESVNDLRYLYSHIILGVSLLKYAYCTI